MSKFFIRGDEIRYYEMSENSAAQRRQRVFSVYTSPYAADKCGGASIGLSID